MFLRVAIALTLLSSTLSAAEKDKVYRKKILPILKARCVKCHGPKKQESKIRLDTLSIDVINNRAAAEYWHEVLNVLNSAEMPPKDAPQLTKAERKILVDWVTATVKRAVDARKKTDGRVVMRRLNRVAYQHTMRDLLGLQMRYNIDLPPDAISSEGFRNDGRSLRMSGLQLEYYLKTARKALDRIIVIGKAPKVYKYSWKKPNVKAWKGRPEFSARLGRQQEFLAKMKKEYPEEGEFLVRVKLKAELKKNIGYPILDVTVGYRPDTQILFRTLAQVEITSEKEQTFEFRGRLEEFPLPVRGQGKFPGLVVRVRNTYDDGSKKPKGKGKGKNVKYPDEKHLPKLLIQQVDFQGPYFKKWPPQSHREILFDSPLQKKNEDKYVGEVLKRFMARAYRRPATRGEVLAMVAFFKAIKPTFPTFEGAMKETLAMVLIRPDFLYLVEPAGSTKRPVSNWEMATRLSYFLWCTMPDERLTKLAATGKIREPKVLAKEVDRMLKDERSFRFVQQFTEQWLHLNVVDSVAISRDYHPKFKSEIKNEMRAETHHYVAELLRHNMSALNLLSSDFTMINEKMAKHYGVKGVYGSKYRRHKWKKKDRRGGLLGHASILLSNSTGSDSHPVRRAVWIRDRLLNDKPAPPPPDVPSLEDGDPKFHKLSIREQLVIHRKREACASCHRNIDPWGIALEHFDAVGLYRKKVRRKEGKKFKTIPVVAVDTLPNGQKLDGVEQLKKYLVSKRKKDFARGLVVRLLTFSLGRRLELSDKSAVDTLTKQFEQDKYRLRSLVQRVVSSQPFLTK